MSPSKKKTAKKAAKKKAARTARKKAAKTATKKAARKASKRASASSARKKAAKKAAKAPAKKATAKATKAAAKTAPKKSAKAPTAKSKAASRKKATGSAKKQAKSKKGAAAAKSEATEAETPAPKRARARRPITPPGPRHPKLGYKWACFDCGAKFYDLGKEDPVCPKCQADQRDRPPDEPKRAAEPAKPKVVRPMAQLLDEEEPRPASGDSVDLDELDLPGGGEEMFDDTDDADLDLDEADDTVVRGASDIDEL